MIFRDLLNIFSTQETIMTAIEFCNEMEIPVNFAIGKAIIALPQDKLRQLTGCVCSDDYLIHVDCDGFSVNHGNVGSRGIRYDFN